MLEINPSVVPSRRTRDCGAKSPTGSLAVGSSEETQDPALILLGLWMAWPNACLTWQREVHDTWVAIWSGGVPLDG
ncbi:hypothetical protein [Roseateles depolymerans]|uniref:Uncharacterized protein n=1 Tax=Roseateles depolymerans TaxID=76731 RepID=A0A0U3LGG3_9BURK|nr:hypothetical protein [Roseateles depolymerans]ALV07167.1 hypothetical protein RD2015_2702 [Roseateles depolymerans]REG20150.1 hypothetical protein DES44_2657 [Roseateles depolymerans]